MSLFCFGSFLSGRLHYFFGSSGSNFLKVCDVSHLSIGLRNRVNCRACLQSKHRGTTCLIPEIPLEFLGSFIFAYNEFRNIPLNIKTRIIPRGGRIRHFGLKPL